MRKLQRIVAGIGSRLNYSLRRRLICQYSREKQVKAKRKTITYKFKVGTKTYAGVCKGCETKRKADAYEKEIKGKAIALSKRKSVKAIVENFRDEPTGGNPYYGTFGEITFKA